MYRFIKCDKDAYATNKYIAGSRSIDANTGESATLDLYCLKDETAVSGGSGLELSRAFLHFDLNPLRAVTGSLLDITSSAFKCYLKLFDVYGGQTTPSNFTLSLFPLAKSFTEGRGTDVIGFRDVDAVNWVTASVLSGAVTLWTTTGSSTAGSLGASNVDYYVSGTSGILGLIPLGVHQTFGRGDEDLVMDITTLVSGTLVGAIPDNGFRLSFFAPEETDATTRFVKRFTSRHSRNHFKHPQITAQYNNAQSDHQLASFFDTTNTIGIYNSVFGQQRNFFSGSTEITGANCLMIGLHASKSVTSTTTSWSSTHSASINHLTTSFSYFSMSFSGSQRTVGSNKLTGSYFANVNIGSLSSSLTTFMGTDQSVNFQPFWKSLDGTVLYSSGTVLAMKKIKGSNSSVAERNFVVNVTNLKATYTRDEVARLRVFVQDYDVDRNVYYVPVDNKSEVYRTMHWRLVHAFTREVVVPFDLADNGTLLSSDGAGMWFDLYATDFPVDQVYEFEFLIRELGQDYVTTNQGFRFKVTR